MSSLPDALHAYAALELDCSERLRRLEADFGMRVGKTALAKLNKQFGVPTSRARASSFSTPSASSSQDSAVNPTTSNKSHKASNRISFICDELSSDKPTRAPLRRSGSENLHHKRRFETENHLPSRRTNLDHFHTRSSNRLDPTPVPAPAPAPAPARQRWWYAQHADLKLELNELVTGFALDVLKRQKMGDKPKPVSPVKRASTTTVRRPFSELSRPIAVGN